MRILFFGFAAAAALFSACAPSASLEEREAPPIAVSLDRAAMTELPASFEAGGVVRARVTASIASRVMAPITEIHVSPGDRVRRGSPLVRLDGRAPLADAGRAQAAFTSAEASGRAAEADLLAADSALVLARATCERIEALHAKRSATPQELDQAVAARAAAEAQRASAEARLASAKAELEAAREAAEAARAQAAYAVLSAPFDALVTARYADPGSMATPGAPILTLEDPSGYRLEVEIDEARAALVTTGGEASVRIEGAPAVGEEWVVARVVETARLDPLSHRFLVKIDLPSAGEHRSGRFGRARFPGPARRALTVPGSSLVSRGQIPFVYLVDAEGRARLRPVAVVQVDGQRSEILAGVREGDLIVASPPASLSDGALVAAGTP